ncbi:MAG: hypothetical protein LCH51_16330 [Bacteroidetes bacterium]|nr:hypothetical protein [Bacteroidota bacterium]
MTEIYQIIIFPACRQNQKIDGIVALLKQAEIFIKEKTPDIYSKELLEMVFRQPYSMRKFLEDAGLVKKTAGTYLSQLEDLGVLTGLRVGKDNC